MPPWAGRRGPESALRCQVVGHRYGEQTYWWVSKREAECLFPVERGRSGETKTVKNGVDMGGLLATGDRDAVWSWAAAKGCV